MLKIKLDIQRFAVNTSISGNDTNISITANTSYINGTITISTTGSTYNQEGTAYYQINGGPAQYFSIGRNSTITRDYSVGPYTHNPDGSLGNQIVSVYVRITSSTSTSASISVPMQTIPRYAITNDIEGTNIEDIFKVNYTKYVSSWQYKLRISIPNIQLLDRIDYNTSGEEFELSQTVIETLFNYYTTTNNVSLGFAVETWDGNTKLSDGNEIIITGKILNANPIFSDFDFEDINNITLALTDDNSININNYSTIEATISTLNKAIAQKGASMSKYRFICGSNTPVEVAYDDESSVNLIMNNAPNGTYQIYAIDSRNNSTLVTKLATQEIAYIPINFISSNCKVERSNNGVGENAILTLSGEIWNNNFGLINNSIKSILVEYKETSSSTWLESPTTITPTVSGNSFNFTGQIGSQAEDYTFELNKSYDFRLTISDELSTKSIQLTPMASAIPNISFADNGVGIMCDYDENLGGDLQVGGYPIYESGTNYIKYADGTMICYGISTIINFLAQNDSDTNIYFPAEFVDTNYSVQITFHSSFAFFTYIYLMTYNRTKDSVNIGGFNTYNSTLSGQLDYIVIGKWK